MNVVPIEPCRDIPTMLRDLADRIEHDGLNYSRITVVCPDGEIYNFGSPSPSSSTDTVFDCQLAIHRVMCAAYGVDTRLEQEQ